MADASITPHFSGIRVLRLVPLLLFVFVIAGIKEYSLQRRGTALTNCRRILTGLVKPVWPERRLVP
jgi:hypothetical protein